MAEPIYDPVDEYVENADDPVPSPETDQTSGFTVYVDPDHHRSGNMETVEDAYIDPLTGVVVVPGADAPEPPSTPADGDTGADPATPEG